MRTYKLILLFCTLIFLFVTPVLAATQNYESAATSRIVGSSPADLIKQLQNNKEMNLENGVVYDLGDYLNNPLWTKSSEYEGGKYAVR